MDFGLLLCFQDEKVKLMCLGVLERRKTWFKASFAFLAKFFKQDKSLCPLKYIVWLQGAIVEMQHCKNADFMESLMHCDNLKYPRRAFAEAEAHFI